MAKKKEPEKVWVVVSSDGHIESFPTLLSAQNDARDYLEMNEGESLYVLEVTKAWTIEFPPEPSPEVEICPLHELP